MCVRCTRAARASASWLQLGEQTTGGAYPPSGVQRSADRMEREKKTQRVRTVSIQQHRHSSVFSKSERSCQDLSVSFCLTLMLRLCMSLSPLQSVSSSLLSSLVLFYLWLPMKSQRLLHTYVDHKSAIEKDSGQEEREMENRREAFAVVWATA